MNNAVEAPGVREHSKGPSIESLILKAGLIIQPSDRPHITTEEKIVSRYSLLATYYADACEYTVTLPLSHDYHRHIEAASYPPVSGVPKFDPVNDRGLHNMMGDLAILQRDMDLVPDFLQEQGKTAIKNLRLYIGMSKEEGN